MDRINQILNQKQYQVYLEKNKMAEADRSFCHHNIEHFLNVARLAMLINLQENMQINKDYIYATAFLHDIGRFVEYEGSRPHDIVSAEIAEELLPQCGFSQKETEMIAKTIAGHRKHDRSGEKTEHQTEHEVQNITILRELLKRADRLSRNCQWCEARELCNWTEEQKNHTIDW